MKVKNNLAYSSLQFVVVDIIGDVLSWPLWWYSRGFLKTARFCLNSIKDEYQRSGLGIWLKNLFIPMFGQYDWEGRIISFFARLIQVIFRSLIILFWSAIYLALILVWLIAPIFVFYQVVNNTAVLLG